MLRLYQGKTPVLVAIDDEDVVVAVDDVADGEEHECDDRAVHVKEAVFAFACWEVYDLDSFVEDADAEDVEDAGVEVRLLQAQVGKDSGCNRTSKGADDHALDDAVAGTVNVAVAVGTVAAVGDGALTYHCACECCAEEPQVFFAAFYQKRDSSDTVLRLLIFTLDTVILL